MNKTFIYIIVALVLAGGIWFVATQPSTPAPATQNVPSVTQTPAPSTPSIESAVMSRSIDIKGNATGAATTFSATNDKMVYAVLSLKNIVKGTTLSYARYLNGKYIDSKVAVASKDGIVNFHFSFEKGIGDYPKGSYMLNLYVNGKKSQSLNYTFN